MWARRARGARRYAATAQRLTLNSSRGRLGARSSRSSDREAPQDRAQREAPASCHQDEEARHGRVLTDETDAVPRTGRRRHPRPGAKDASLGDARQDFAHDARLPMIDGRTVSGRAPSVVTGSAGQPPPITNVPCGV